MYISINYQTLVQLISITLIISKYLANCRIFELTSVQDRSMIDVDCQQSTSVSFLIITKQATSWAIILSVTVHSVGIRTLNDSRVWQMVQNFEENPHHSNQHLHSLHFLRLLHKMVRSKNISDKSVENISDMWRLEEMSVV